MSSNSEQWAILTDVTKCIGCEACVEGCKKTHDTGEDRPWPWQDRINGLSATRWTTIDRVEKGRYVRRQCRHCEEPACASACPVGALKKTPEGPVVYDAYKCMGCRYCMMACPFQIPRYTWDAVPSIRKCVLCAERIWSGEAQQPACTEACPTGATIFGSREDLLAEAKRRIADAPEGGYLDHVWGEHEAGGTSVLTISDVDIELPETVPYDSLPHRTWGVLKTVPVVFVGMGAAMLGLRWFFGRRDRVRAEEAAEQAQAEPAEAPVAEGEDQ